MSEISNETSRQIGVLLNRKGQVEYVMVGTAKQIEMPDFGRCPRIDRQVPRAAVRSYTSFGRKAHAGRPDRLGSAEA